MLLFVGGRRALWLQGRAVLFSDLADSPLSSSAQTQGCLMGSSAVGFTKLSLLLFLFPPPRSPGAEARHFSKGQGPLLCLGEERSSRWEEWAVSRHKCSISGLVRTLAAMPGCLLTGAAESKHCLFCSGLVTSAGTAGTAGHLCQLLAPPDAFPWAV